MADHIIGVPLKRDSGKLPFHPLIESIVQKEIRQQGTNDSMNAKDNLATQLFLRAPPGYSVLRQEASV